MAAKHDDVATKVVTTVAALAAAAAAQRALANGWRFVTGRSTPAKDDDSSVAEVVVFAALSAAAVAVARTVATRKASALLNSSRS